MKNIFIIIAAYNESKHISNVLKEIKKSYGNIIVVDDGSKDNTFEVSKKERVIVLKHIVNLGKGAAMKTGCDYAIKNNADILVLVDADGQHEPKEIPEFLKKIKEKDIVFGYRTFNKKMPKILSFGNKFINFVTKLLYGLNLKDTQCGYRAFTARAYKKIRWQSLDYSMESEMIANAGKHHLKYAQVPIATIYSEKYKGTTVLDGIKIVMNMLLWRLKR